MKSSDDIRRIFSRVARGYDINNRIHSFWQDQRWRRRAVQAAGVRPGWNVLDAACGTGDMAGLLASGPAGRVVGLDFCREMLEVAHHKYNDPRVEWVEGDVLAMPFDASSFDAAIIAFGLRNAGDVKKALDELARVIRPGGRLVVLEFFSRDAEDLAEYFARFYLNRIMPITAAIIAGGLYAEYRYFVDSIAGFISPHTMARRLQSAGFEVTGHEKFIFGMADMFRASKI